MPPRNVYGNRGFGILRGLSFRNGDFGAMKNFYFTESRYLQFRAQLFNFPNFVNFGQPNASLCGEGTITSVASSARQI